MMRISLYKHELEAINALTIQLTRLAQETSSDVVVEDLGPKIFERLLHATYAHGNYKDVRYVDRSTGFIRD